MTSLALIVPLVLAIAGGALVVFSEGESAHEIFMATSILPYVKSRQDRANVRTRLVRLNREDGYERFYLKQIAVASVTACIAMIVGFAVFGASLQVPLLSVLLCCASFVLVDRSLTREVHKRKNSIENEFAPVIEMLTLSLSAGETPLGAMNRIADRSDGYLAAEFTRVVETVRQGTSFHIALDAMGVRIDSVIIRRFVDSLIIAMLRGAPLVEVLQRHALEARANQRNLLMDKAGKAEISMMIPVVFLILPISVLFALWPSLTNLNLFAS